MRFPAVFNPASWSPVVLVRSFLLPFGRLSELSVFIMAILGTRASGARALKPCRCRHCEQREAIQHAR